ncbi:MAG TPA: MarR family winged helix-turn-helix transcriptional regulator [Acidimicrobiales bacterium]
MSPPDHHQLPLGLDVTRTGRLLATAFDQALAEAGGSLPTWQVLTTLARDDGSTQRGIAAAIGIEGATLTHHLNRMEAEGLVTRTRVPTDRRTHRVELTDAGRQTFRRLLTRVVAFDTRLRAGLDPAEEATLRSLLARLRANSAGAGRTDTPTTPSEAPT